MDIFKKIKFKHYLILVLFIIILAVFYIAINANTRLNLDNLSINHMQISSPAFGQNQKIPVKYACNGQNINPRLDFSDIPYQAKSLAFIMDDPDAPMGTWVHWVIWNINPGISSIGENNVPAGAIQGKTSSGKFEYAGPCPPSGTHHYHFKLYALDSTLDIPATTDKAGLLKAMEGHIVEQTELIGLYSKN